VSQTAAKGVGMPLTPGRQRKIDPPLLGSSVLSEVTKYMSAQSGPPKATLVTHLAGTFTSPISSPVGDS
jgi:hypothetical protein